MRKNWIKISLCSSLLGLLPVVGFAATETHYYYRYKDTDGHQVITSTLPSDVADQGYDIISPRGNVIKTVQPAKTKEEIAQDEKALEEKRKADLKEIENKKQAEIQAKKDDILLKSFSNEDDIIRSRDEKIASIEVLEQIMRENITRLNKQLKEANESKATFVQAGQKIPDSLEKTISETQRQIKDNEAFIQRKTIEKENIHTKYQGLIDRFHQLNKHENQPSATPTPTPTSTSAPSKAP
ncbi:MAG: hypothetical protein JSR17_04600 [Proteobacteria bacterium]|nr:hypothetical protein [Pseudomonadota bacterium]